MNKHTPGPWVWGSDYDGLFNPESYDDVLDYRRYENMVLAYGEQREANARLIAAAPDLLQALQSLMAMRDRCFIENENNWWDDMANAAIAKATEGAE